ncbi:hypothetical protein HA402_002526 [Bradysia odoriphaga]|nr:hypothetical protein HA402_002526 [Bradysia odoriphaga]
MQEEKLEDGQHVNELILRYSYGKTDVIIDLKLNHNFIPHNHFLRYQLPNGTDAVQHFTKTDVDLCHYKGTIRNNAASYAAISTCNGINGVIYDGNDTYYVDTNNRGNEHYLYRYSDRIQIQSNDSTCGHGKHEIETFMNENFKFGRKIKRSTDGTIRGPSKSNRQSLFVEFVLVVDNAIYRDFGRDFKKIHKYCKDIGNVVNALYESLNIFIILVGVSIWNEKDRINLSSDSSKTLEEFLRHRREVLMLEHPNDNAHLLTNQKFERSVIGHAILNAMCTHKSSGGITHKHSPSTGIVASTIAHEMGHNFGMYHDTEQCECESPPCIMEHTTSNVVAFSWSSCSKDQLNLAFDRGQLQCLRNKPTALTMNPECGNGFVEPGEQCDCGLPEYCQNSCCNPNTCMLQSNASCATGECCDLTTCRMRPVETVCRPSDGECDLPEYCTHGTEYCPENRYKRDTELCDDGNAYCYEGACRSHSNQCKLLWGAYGESVDECYGNNVNGDMWGNCGKNWPENSLKKCSEEDILCGQLQCKPTDDDHELKSSYIDVRRGYSPVYPYFPCQAVVFDLGLHNVDPGLSPNGAKCGEGKICIRQRCMSIESLRFRGIGVNCPENCNGHGSCDNKGHCHCDTGYLPPLCKSTVQEWSGSNGSSTSLDDGIRFVQVMYAIVMGVLCQYL